MGDDQNQSLLSQELKKIGKKGGDARAKSVSADRRKQIAREGALARWADHKGAIPRAVYGSSDSPLRIAGLEIPCYVLDDGRRVLVQRGMLTGLTMSQGTAGRGAGDRLARFVNTKALKDFVSDELRNVITNPIKFRVGGSTAYGYEASVLGQLCDVVITARDAGSLHYQQEHIADQCQILNRAFREVGIVALVDEATGYQVVRARNALAQILEDFIAKELRVWVQTFPEDFYSELFRLRGLEYPAFSVRRPQYFGTLTNDIVYKRMAPGVLDELKRLTPRSSAGRAKHKYFQRLTNNVGYPKLREHLGSVVTIMKLSDDWQDFRIKLDRLHPRYGDNLMLEFEPDQDNGRGL